MESTTKIKKLIGKIYGLTKNYMQNVCFVFLVVKVQQKDKKINRN
jgi:hypothetical protein